MSYSRSSLELNGNGGGVMEEQVIDDYYVSLQNGEIDSRQRITTSLGKSNKQQPGDRLLEELKQNLHSDLDKIAAHINSSGKNKWRNSTKPNTVQQSNHLLNYNLKTLNKLILSFNQ